MQVSLPRRTRNGIPPGMTEMTSKGTASGKTRNGRGGGCQPAMSREVDSRGVSFQLAIPEMSRFGRLEARPTLADRGVSCQLAAVPPENSLVGRLEACPTLVDSRGVSCRLAVLEISGLGRLEACPTGPTAGSKRQARSGW